MDRGHVVASGRGIIHSFLVHHAPQVPGKTLPLTLGLIELEEGVRMVGAVRGEGLEIGAAVDVVFDRIDDDLTLASWTLEDRLVDTGAGRPAHPTAASDLPISSIAITPTLVVSTALATRDFQDVHHDRDLAVQRGSKDIFLNILTTTGLVQKYVVDWAGHDWRVTDCSLRLGAPAHPGDTLELTGTIVSRTRWRDRGRRDRCRAVRRPRDVESDRAAVIPFSGAAAIAGIGATEFSKESGRSELQLSCEATLHALADAGLTPQDVDGLVTFTMDNSSEIALARELGHGRAVVLLAHQLRRRCRLRDRAAGRHGCCHRDGRRPSSAYRGFNERSGDRFGQVSLGAAAQVNTNGLDNAWTYPHGLSTPAATVAMQARRYMHSYGATSEDFGRVAVADRRHAATNPAAFFYGKPITLADHQASRLIADPLRLLDCCQESDGAVAIVVTTTERARDLAAGAVPIIAAAQGSGADQFVMTSYYRDDIGIPEIGVVGRALWAQSGLSPADMQTAVLYDHFTPYVLMQLEELGFCGRGEAPGFIADGAIELGGRLPINTHGGQLGEAYIHGMNGIAEGVRQIRGTSVNQVDGVEHVLVTAGTGVPTSGLILGR